MSEKLSAKEIVELWKTAINVEQHFNTVEMTVRNIFATIVVALIAGIGYSIKEKSRFRLESPLLQYYLVPQFSLRRFFILSIDIGTIVFWSGL